jgi:hypothetical protein
MTINADMLPSYNVCSDCPNFATKNNKRNNLSGFGTILLLVGSMISIQNIWFNWKSKGFTAGQSSLVHKDEGRKQWIRFPII